MKKTVQERIAANSHMTESGCVVWDGAVYRNGYGKIKYHGKTTQVHRALYDELYGPLPPRVFITQTCGNRRCGNIDHLKMVTPKQSAIATVQKGHKTNTRLNIHLAAAIRMDPRPLATIAEAYDIGVQTVRQIKNETAWSHVNSELVHEYRRSKLTEHDVRAIRASPESTSALAQKYGVAYETVYGVRNRTRWRWVQ